MMKKTLQKKLWLVAAFFALCVGSAWAAESDPTVITQDPYEDLTLDGVNYHCYTDGDKIGTAEIISTSSSISGSLTIPATVGDGGYAVTTIRDEAFYNRPYLTSVIIPHTVTTIGARAFYSCSGLTSVTIPYSVKTIGASAFEDCYGLTSVTIPHTVTTIGKYAFYRCSGLTSVTIGNSVKTIGYSAFGECDGLTSVTIPNSVTTIGERAFLNCDNLKEINVDEGNAHYSSDCGVLYNKAQTELIQAGEAFSGSYTIPNSVTTIGGSAFRLCSGLTSVTIPNSVTTIGSSAFKDCTGLKEVYLPYSIPSLDMSNVFYNCSNIETIYLRLASDADRISGIPSGATIVETAVKEVSLCREGYATLYLPYPFYLPEGCQAGIVKAVDGTVLHIDYLYQPGDFVPKYTAVILKGTGGTNTLGYPAEYIPSPTAPTGNLLKGVLEETTIAGDVDFVHYILSYNQQGKNLGFYWANPTGFGIDNLPAYKCYLELPWDAAAATSKFFFLEGDGETTDIENILPTIGAEQDDAPIYTLEGCRVTNPGKGIYIKNGKKFIIK